MPRRQTNLETEKFNLLTRSTGTVTARFRSLLQSGRASQTMMENAIIGTVEYLETKGFDRLRLGELLNVRTGNNQDIQQSQPRQDSGRDNVGPGVTRDSRSITANREEAKEEAFTAPDKTNTADTVNYQCAGCGCLVQRSMSACPGCQQPLFFNRVGV